MALTGAFGLNLAAGQFFAPLTDSRGWDLGTLSAAAGLNTAVSGLAQPILGRLIDRVGTRPVLAACLALMGAAFVLMASADALWQWLAAYGLLAGIGFAGSSSLAVTVLISRWYVRDRARVLPRVFLGINAGQLSLVPLGGILIESAGYRAAYLSLGVTVLALVVPLVALLAVSHPRDVGQHPDGRPSPPESMSPGTTLAEAMRSRTFWLATLAFGINGWTLYFTLLHLPRYARDLGGSVQTGGALIAIAAASSALSMVAISKLVGRWGKRRLVIVLFWWRAAVLAVAVLATTSGQLPLVAAAFGAASFPVVPLVMGLIGDRYGTDVLGRLLGLVFVSHQVFAGAGVLVAGALRVVTGSYDVALLVAAALLIAGSGLLVALDDTVPPDQTSPRRAGGAATPPRHRQDRRLERLRRCRSEHRSGEDGRACLVFGPGGWPAAAGWRGRLAGWRARCHARCSWDGPTSGRGCGRRWGRWVSIGPGWCWWGARRGWARPAWWPTPWPGRGNGG